MSLMINGSPSRDPRPFQARDIVTIGGGIKHWEITGFFGEFSDIASLTAVDNPGYVNTSARISRLHEVQP